MKSSPYSAVCAMKSKGCLKLTRRVVEIRQKRRDTSNEMARVLPMKPITKTIQVFDPAMCCSTGVCGAEVDLKLVQFAADLDRLKSAGVLIQRYNLSQNPGAFVENNLVRATLTEQGEKALPLVLVNGKVAVMGRYPDGNELAKLAKVKVASASASKSGCCSGGTC